MTEEEKVDQDVHPMSRIEDDAQIHDEQSVTALLKEVVRQRESVSGTAVEESAVGESDTNASVERAIQDVEVQTRTLRAGVERKIGRRIKLGDEVTPWMVRHAACLITQ